MARKVGGWILFAWGIGGVIYTLLSAPLIGLPFELGLEALVIWGGWKLAHPKPKLEGGKK